MNKEVSLNAKLEVAIEIISAMIAEMSNKGYTVEDKEMKKLLEERTQVYLVNNEVLNRVINEYGPKLREKYEGVKK